MPARRQWRRRWRRRLGALGTIAGVNEITSSSSLSSTRVTLQFDLGKNIDSAAREVQSCDQRSTGNLAEQPAWQPGLPKANPADSPVMVLIVDLEVADPLDRCTTRHPPVAQRISQIEGVGNVNVGGGSLPAVRVALDLPTVSATGVSLEEVRGAIANNNVNRPKGGSKWATGGGRLAPMIRQRRNICRWW